MVNLLSVFVIVPYAGEIYENAKLAKDIVQAISLFFNPLCVLGFGFSIIQIMLASNQKSVSNGLGFAKTVIAAFIIFNCLGTLISYSDSLDLTKSYTYSSSTIESVMNNKKSRENTGNGGTGHQNEYTQETTNQSN